MGRLVIIREHTGVRHSLFREPTGAKILQEPRRTWGPDAGTEGMAYPTQLKASELGIENSGIMRFRASAAKITFGS